MAHQLPHVAGAVTGAVNVLGTAAAVSARPAGEGRTHHEHLHVPNPVAPPPKAPQIGGGLAGVRQAAKPLHAEPTMRETEEHLGIKNVHDEVPAQDSPEHLGVSALNGQEPNLDTVAEYLDQDYASAAVSTRDGPQADPYHLGGR